MSRTTRYTNTGSILLWCVALLVAFSCNSSSQNYKVSVQLTIQGKNGPQIDQVLYPIFEELFASSKGILNRFSLAGPESYRYTVEIDKHKLTEADAYNMLRIKLRSLEPYLDAFGAQVSSIAPPLYSSTETLVLQVKSQGNASRSREEVERLVEALERLVEVNWIDRSQIPTEELRIYLRNEEMARRLITNDRILLELEEIELINRPVFEGDQAGVARTGAGFTLDQFQLLTVPNARAESVRIEEFSEVELNQDAFQNASFQLRVHGANGISMDALYQAVLDEVQATALAQNQVSYLEEVECWMPQSDAGGFDIWEDKLSSVFEATEFKVLEGQKNVPLVEYTPKRKKVFESGVSNAAVADAIQIANQGLQLGYVWLQNPLRKLPVKLRLKPDSVGAIETQKIRFRDYRQNLVRNFRLEQLVMKREVEPKRVGRWNGKPALVVQGRREEAAGSKAATETLLQRLEAFDLPEQASLHVW